MAFFSASVNAATDAMKQDHVRNPSLVTGQAAQPVIETLVTNPIPDQTGPSESGESLSKMGVSMLLTYDQRIIDK